MASCEDTARGTAEGAFEPDERALLPFRAPSLGSRKEGKPALGGERLRVAMVTLSGSVLRFQEVPAKLILIRDIRSAARARGRFYYVKYWNSPETLPR